MQLESITNVSVNLTLEQLEDYVREVVAKALEEVKCQPHEELYLSLDETMKLLRVGRTTLWEWNKKGYLVAHKVGKSVRYKKSDIIKIQEA